MDLHSVTASWVFIDDNDIGFDVGPCGPLPIRRFDDLYAASVDGNANFLSTSSYGAALGTSRRWWCS